MIINTTPFSMIAKIPVQEKSTAKIILAYPGIVENEFTSIVILLFNILPEGMIRRNGRIEGWNSFYLEVINREDTRTTRLEYDDESFQGLIRRQIVIEKCFIESSLGNRVVSCFYYTQGFGAKYD